MATIAVPNTFSPNTTISSSEVNNNFSTIYNEFNGSIDAANLATDSVVAAKIASNAVTTVKLADSSVTGEKLSSTVAFRAYSSSTQSLSTGVDTKIQLDTEVYDLGSDFDNATNYRFTAPYAGVYQINFSARISSPSADQVLSVKLRLNGTTLVGESESTGNLSSVNTNTRNGSVTLSLSASDYIELWVSQNGGTKSVAGEMSGFLVGRT